MAQTELVLKLSYRGVLLDSVVVRVVSGVIGTFVPVFIVSTVRLVMPAVIVISVGLGLSALIVRSIVGIVLVFGNLFIKSLVVVIGVFLLDAVVVCLWSFVVLASVMLCKDRESANASGTTLNSGAALLLTIFSNQGLWSTVRTVRIVVTSTRDAVWCSVWLKRSTHHVHITLIGELDVSSDDPGDNSTSLF
jgi:hypothetical protein